MILWMIFLLPDTTLPAPVFGRSNALQPEVHNHLGAVVGEVIVHQMYNLPPTEVSCKKIYFFLEGFGLNLGEHRGSLLQGGFEQLEQTLFIARELIGHWGGLLSTEVSAAQPQDIRGQVSELRTKTHLVGSRLKIILFSREQQSDLPGIISCIGPFLLYFLEKSSLSGQGIEPEQGDDGQNGIQVTKMSWHRALIFSGAIRVDQ